MPEPSRKGRVGPTPEDFQHLLAFRVGLRQFQHWSETQARAAGLTHTQHQLLVAVKGHPGSVPPAIGDLAMHILVKAIERDAHHAFQFALVGSSMQGVVRFHWMVRSKSIRSVTGRP